MTAPITGCVDVTRDLTDFVHPDTRPANWAAHRALNNALEMVVTRGHVTGRLLDIGCGLKPYQPLLAPYVTEHVGVDHPDSPHALTSVDVFATAYEIPLDDQSFDTILLSEVLEHLERPTDALTECHRLLRQGGRLVLSTPMLWTLHEEPRDFYRYTPYGLRYLLDTAGFDVVEMIALGGQWLSVAMLFSHAISAGPLYRWPRVVAGIQSAAQRIGVRMNAANQGTWLSHSHLAVAVRR
jgi:SAM-dependent methyltransferase